jgi:hypothetical protein
MTPLILRRLAPALLATLVALPAAAQQPAGQRRPPARVPTVAIPTDSQGRIIFHREVYTYPRDGRRDPFASLIATGDIRPLFADLEISVIIEHPDPRQSIATLKDRSTGTLYKARVGSVFGRIRVTYIRAGVVGLAIDEFGFTRREELTNNTRRGGSNP